MHLQQPVGSFSFLHKMRQYVIVGSLCHKKLNVKRFLFVCLFVFASEFEKGLLLFLNRSRNFPEMSVVQDCEIPQSHAPERTVMATDNQQHEQQKATEI